MLRGLTYMNQPTTRLTTVQLQQRLIHAQAEIAKLKKELERYKNDYHYSMIDELSNENEQLHLLYEELKAKSDVNENQHQKPSEPTSSKSQASLPVQENSTTKPAEPVEAEDPVDSVFINSSTSAKKNQEAEKNQDETSSWFSRSIKTRSKK